MVLTSERTRTMYPCCTYSDTRLAISLTCTWISHWHSAMQTLIKPYALRGAHPPFQEGCLPGLCQDELSHAPIYIRIEKYPSPSAYYGCGWLIP